MVASAMTAATDADYGRLGYRLKFTVDKYPKVNGVWFDEDLELATTNEE